MSTQTDLEIRCAGYIVMATPRRSGVSVIRKYAPMSQGLADYPDPDILMFRDLATIYPSEREATKALKETVEWAEKEGHTWMKKYYFLLMPVLRPNVSFRGGP